MPGLPLIAGNMNTNEHLQAMRTTIVASVAVVLLGACSSMQPTAQQYDGVYDKPEREPLAAVAPAEERAPVEKRDDYYDPGQAQVQRNYYDMAYNDPYYYNYGRFGFGSPGWNSGWGMGMGYGNGWNQSYYGGGWGTGWSNNYWDDPYSGNGWNNGFYGGYGNPYGGYGNGYWGGGGPYNGYGYYGYGGNCYGCYQPIVFCGNGQQTVITRRPTMSSGGNGTGTGGAGGNGSSRVSYSSRSPVSLMPVVSGSWEGNTMGMYMPGHRPAYQQTLPQGGRYDKPSSSERRPSYERRPADRPSISIDNRGGSTPSRTTDGGSRPVNTPRPR